MSDKLVQDILGADQPVVVSGRERDVESLLRGHSGVVRFVRGKRCRNEQELFGEFAAALQFPYYFGENWDAFDECIQDLSWLSSDTYIIVVTQANVVLSEGDSFATLLKILEETAKQWRDGSAGPDNAQKATFAVVLHCEADKQHELQGHLGIVDLPLRQVPRLDDVE